MGKVESFGAKFTEGLGGNVTEGRLGEAVKLYEDLGREMGKQNLYEVC